jgi:large subunit ribosomal protein L7/L12
MADLQGLVEQLDQLTLLEAAELSKLLQEKWGVSAAAPMAVAAGGPVAAAGGAAAPAAEEQTEFDIVITDSGANKIQVIKVIRELTGLGLREAKAAAEELPSKIKEGISKDEAAQVRAKLEEAGAKVEVK